MRGDDARPGGPQEGGDALRERWRSAGYFFPGAAGAASSEPICFHSCA